MVQRTLPVSTLPECPPVSQTPAQHLSLEEEQNCLHAHLQSATWLIFIVEMKHRTMWPPKCQQTLHVASPELEQGPPNIAPQGPEPQSGVAHQGGLTWSILQPVHRQRPDDSDPWGVHGNQEHRLLLVARGLRVRFSHKHTELAARIQDACRKQRENKSPQLMPGPPKSLSPSSGGPGKARPGCSKHFVSSESICRLQGRKKSELGFVAVRHESSIVRANV